MSSFSTVLNLSTESLSSGDQNASEMVTQRTALKEWELIWAPEAREHKYAHHCKLLIIF